MILEFFLKIIPTEEIATSIIISSIQLVGVITAIIGGLLINKIINMRNDKKQLEVAIDDMVHEIDFINTKLKKQKEINEAIFIDNIYYDYIKSKVEDSEFNYKLCYNEVMDDKEKENSFNKLVKIITEFDNKFNSGTFKNINEPEVILKKMGYVVGSQTFEILETYLEKKEEGNGDYE